MAACVRQALCSLSAAERNPWEERSQHVSPLSWRCVFGTRFRALEEMAEESHGRGCALHGCERKHERCV